MLLPVLARVARITLLAQLKRLSRAKAQLKRLSRAKGVKNGAA